MVTCKHGRSLIFAYKGSAFVDNTVDCRHESALWAPERPFGMMKRRRSKECRGIVRTGREVEDGMLSWELVWNFVDDMGCVDWIIWGCGCFK